MLEKNLAAIRPNYPEVAEFIENTPLDPNVVLFLGPHEDVSVAYHGIPLHYPDDPIGEALAVFESEIPESARQTESIVVLYGLGLGYLLRRLFINTTCQIIVYEPYPAVLRQTLEVVDLSQELGSRRVTIITDLQDLFRNFSDRYLVGDNMRVLALPSYQAIHPETYLAVLNEARTILLLSVVSQNTNLKSMANFVTASLENLTTILKYPEPAFLNDQFKGVPGILVSAGPSLDNPGVLDALRAMQPHAMISCVGQAAKALDRAGIVPDLVSIVENQNVAHQLDGVSFLSQINLITMPQTFPGLFQVPTQRKMVAYPLNEPLTWWLSRALDKPLHGYNHQGTVAVTAYLMLVAMGCNPIILLGQDLAYPKGKMYASNAVYNGWQIVTDEHGNRDLVAPNKQEFFGDKAFFKNDADWEQHKRNYFGMLVETKDWQGEPITTIATYESFRKVFSILIQGYAAQHQVVNCSEGGAFIDGCEHMPFAQAIEQYHLESHHPKKKLAELFKTHYVEANPGDETYQKVYDRYVHDRGDMQQALALIAQAREETHRISKDLDSQKTLTHSIQSRLHKLDVLDKSIQEIVQQNPLTNSYVAVDIYMYSRQYGRKIHLDDTDEDSLAGNIPELKETLNQTLGLYDTIEKGIHKYTTVMDPVMDHFPATDKVEFEPLLSPNPVNSTSPIEVVDGH